MATNLPCSATDIDGLVSTAREHNVDLTVVDPELALADGIVDCFEEHDLVIFCPSRAAARIEASKVCSKDLMLKYGVPCAKSVVFDSLSEAVRYVYQPKPPLVCEGRWPGVLASWTILPVIGVPLPTSEINGEDALHSIVQMPPGVPVACVAVGSWGARNAAHLAAAILSLKHERIRHAYERYRHEQSSR